MENWERQLILNKRLFQKAVSNAQLSLKNCKSNSAVAWAQVAANFAWQRHPGLFYSEPLESVLIEAAHGVNKEIPHGFSRKISVPSANKDKRRVLHVMSQVYSGGGHTRVVVNWIRNTRETSVHGLITTAQAEPLPEDLASVIEESEGWYQPLPSFTNLLEKAFLLRQASRDWADLVVIHTHPFDALPTVAFGETGGPPVIFMNHADHVFWLGSSVADIVADWRLVGQKITLTRRGVKNSKILPLPITKRESSFNRESIRKNLGISDEQIVLFSATAEYKFTPFGGYDFVASLTETLKKNPYALLIVVGGPRLHGRWAQASKSTNGRIKAMGSVNESDLADFYTCADIYVDSFPAGSATSVLEAGIQGLPVVSLHKQEAPSLDGYDALAQDTFVNQSSSLEGFSSLLEDMIACPSSYKEKAKTVQQSIMGTHFAHGWNMFLENILRALPDKHSTKLIDLPDQIPDSSDFFLAGFQAAVHSNDLKNSVIALASPARYLSRKEQLLFTLRFLTKSVRS